LLQAVYAEFGPFFTQTMKLCRLVLKRYTSCVADIPVVLLLLLLLLRVLTVLVQVMPVVLLTVC
jgi:hypothetical protein